MSYERLINKGECLIYRSKLEVHEKYFKGVCYITIFKSAAPKRTYIIEVNYRYKDIRNCIQTYKDLTIGDLVVIIKKLPKDLSMRVMQEMSEKFLYQSSLTLAAARS